MCASETSYFAEVKRLGSREIGVASWIVVVGRGSTLGFSFIEHRLLCKKKNAEASNRCSACGFCLNCNTSPRCHLEHRNTFQLAVEIRSAFVKDV